MIEAGLASIFAELSPDGGIAVAAERIGPAGEGGRRLVGPERGVAARFSPARLAEFAAGRSAARRALQAAGAAPAAIGMGPFGEPLWPAGWDGAISHDGGISVAAACRVAHPHLGLDLMKPEDGLDWSEIADVVRSTGDPPTNDADTTARAFAAKEAAVKTLSRVAGDLVGFDRLALRPDGAACRVLHLDGGTEVRVIVREVSGHLVAGAIRMA